MSAYDYLAIAFSIGAATFTLIGAINTHYAIKVIRELEEDTDRDDEGLLR